MSTIKVDDVEALSTNGNLQIAPNGTGVVEVKVENSDATLQLNDSQQVNNVKIKSPNDTAAQNYTLILPDADLVQDRYIQVDSITGSGSTAVGQLRSAVITPPDLTQLNATNLTSGTVPSSRYTVTAANGAGLKLVSRQFVATSGSIYNIDFTGLQENTMYRIISPYASWGPDTNQVPNPATVAEPLMGWLDSSNAVISSVIIYDKFHGQQGNLTQQTYQTWINLEPGQAINQFNFFCDFYTGSDSTEVTSNETGTYKPWSYSQLTPQGVVKKSETYASIDSGYTYQVYGVRFKAHNGSAWYANTEFLLYEYQET